MKSIFAAGLPDKEHVMDYLSVSGVNITARDLAQGTAFQSHAVFREKTVFFSVDIKGKSCDN